MGDHLTEAGELFMQRSSWRTDQITRPSSITLGLHDDSTDTIADTDALPGNLTKPDGGSYSDNTLSLDGTDIDVSQNGSSNWEMTNGAEQSFDTSDSSNTADSYFYLANFDATATTNGQNGDNIIITGSLSQSYDLSNVDTLKISSTTAGIEQT